MNVEELNQYNFKSRRQKCSNFLGNESVMNQNILLKNNKNLLLIVLFMTFVPFLNI